MLHRGLVMQNFKSMYTAMKKKNQLAPIREFDPRPEEYKGTANQGLDFLL